MASMKNSCRDSIKTEVQSGGHCLSTWFAEELSLCARVHVRCTTPCCARSFAGIKLRGTVEISAISFLIMGSSYKSSYFLAFTR